MADWVLVRLTKIASTHNRLRTPVAEGSSPTWPPVVDGVFRLIGPSLTDPENEELSRMITTSPIVEVKPETTGPDCKAYEIKTLNSTYRVERI